ncbi:MAG: nucleotidyltransferase [Gammaproteobacteria bacterium]|nr:MAG: nucleotidyltransferase [Gammaproteobacteria bacterium]
MEYLDLTSLRKSLDSLSEAIDSVSDTEFMESLSEQQCRLIKAGVIQNFEFTYEASWKMLKRQLVLQEGGADVNLLSRKDLYRLGAQKGLIDAPEKWFEYHRARNETSHTYDQKKSEFVYQLTLTFLPSVKYLLNALEKSNS